MYFMAQHEDTPNGSKSWRKLCIKQQQWDILPKKYISKKPPLMIDGGVIGGPKYKYFFLYV